MADPSPVVDAARAVGIDVSKSSLDVALGQGRPVERFDNTPAGHRALARRLARARPLAGRGRCRQRPKRAESVSNSRFRGTRSFPVPRLQVAEDAAVTRTTKIVYFTCPAMQASG